MIIEAQARFEGCHGWERVFGRRFGSCWLCGQQFGQEGTGGRGRESSAENQLVSHTAEVLQWKELGSEPGLKILLHSPWLGDRR